MSNPEDLSREEVLRLFFHEFVQHQSSAETATAVELEKIFSETRWDLYEIAKLLVHESLYFDVMLQQARFPGTVEKFCGLAIERGRELIGKIRRPQIPVQKGPFYESKEWRAVRYQALKLHGGKCQYCGNRPLKRSGLHVDHIKPRSKYPELELELSNLQVLCKDCNLGKSNIDQTDWRPQELGA